jgi:transposase
MTKTTTHETIGCDIGDKTSEICVLQTNGRKVEASIRTTKKGMTEFFGGRKRAHVVLEVGAHSRWVSKTIEECGHRVTVANARRLKVISESNTKTDRRDAELLARLGRADEDLLSPVTHRSDQMQADLEVAKARDLLVAVRTKVVNHLRGVAKSFGLRLPKCTGESFARQTATKLPAQLTVPGEPLYAVLEKVEEEIKRYDKQIEEIAERYPDTKVVSQPKGVGTLTALVFMLSIGDKNRIERSRMAGAYMGLRPRKSQSGDEDPQLHITKAGNSFVRRLLVNSANYILGPFGQDSDLRRWGLSLAERGGKNAKKRAKVAVARKLAVLMHRLWVTGEVYEPVGYHAKQIAKKAKAA